MFLLLITFLMPNHHDKQHKNKPVFFVYMIVLFRRNMQQSQVSDFPKQYVKFIFWVFSDYSVFFADGRL